MYRIMPTSIRPMPLEVSSQEFTDEWRACWEDENRDTTKLYAIIEPMFIHWEQMLTNEDYPRDINYITMASLLKSRGQDPLEAIKNWVEAAAEGPSVREELELLFFSQLRWTKYYPSKASPRMAEFVIARDFKQRLMVQIAHRYRKPLDVPVEAAIFSLLVTVDYHPDYLLLKNLGLNQWESYLLDLFRTGCTAPDIARITHIPRETFYYEERAVWQRLNQSWSNEEA